MLRLGYRFSWGRKMRIVALATSCCLALLTAPIWAAGDRAGDFDYYVMALSWSPSWCTLEGDDRDAPECAAGAGLGWTLHGLWPQFEEGYPSDCPTTARNPSRAKTAEMSDLFGSSGLAWYQWKKHGRCSGLSATDYYRLARVAYERVNRPKVFRQLDKTVRLPAQVVEDAWMEANPELSDDMMRVTCKNGHIQEVRICLTRDLELRACAPDSLRDCQMSDALFTPLR